MAGLAGEIEKKLAFPNERRDRGRITNIGKIDNHPVADVVDVEKVAAIFRDQAIHESDSCAELDQAPGQGRADESQPSSDKDIGSCKNIEPGGHDELQNDGVLEYCKS